MIVRPFITQLAGTKPAIPTAAARGVKTGATNPGVRLNLRIKRLNIDGLAPSERGIFLTAFQERMTTLAQDAVRRKLWSQLAQKRYAAFRRIDGGAVPSHMDAKSMGEHAASALLREILQ